MLNLPVPPDSAAVAIDDTHVFLSFHWDQQSNYLARDLVQSLVPALEKFLADYGLVTSVEFDGLDNG
jgi:hypothetical protein